MKKLYRSRKDRKIAGVCGGLGEMLSIDPTIVRLVFVLVAVLTAIMPMILVYVVAWIVVPLAPEEKA